MATLDVGELLRVLGPGSALRALVAKVNDARSEHLCLDELEVDRIGQGGKVRRAAAQDDRADEEPVLIDEAQLDERGGRDWALTWRLDSGGARGEGFGRDLEEAQALARRLGGAGRPRGAPRLDGGLRPGDPARRQVPDRPRGGGGGRRDRARRLVRRGWPRPDRGDRRG